MARRSPQTERLVEMLEYLAADPHRDHQLTELARLVDLDPATCYPMLTELTRVGWLVKDRIRKTYRLGPRLVAVGAAAQASLPIATHAHPAMVTLSTSTGIPSCLFIPSSDHLVIADLVYPDGSDTGRLPLQAGDHIEFGPPLGAVLAAWANQYTVDSWLRRVATPGPDDPIRVWQTLRMIRARRFSVELSPAPQAQMREMTDFGIAEVHGARRTERMIGGQRPVMTPDLMLGAIEDQAMYLPLSVSAACFDPSGTPVAALSVLIMAAPHSGDELLALGARVSTAADAITAQLCGH